MARRAALAGMLCLLCGTSVLGQAPFIPGTGMFVTNARNGVYALLNNLGLSSVVDTVLQLEDDLEPLIGYTCLLNKLDYTVDQLGQVKLDKTLEGVGLALACVPGSQSFTGMVAAASTGPITLPTGVKNCRMIVQKTTPPPDFVQGTVNACKTCTASGKSKSCGTDIVTQLLDTLGLGGQGGLLDGLLNTGNGGLLDSLLGPRGLLGGLLGGGNTDLLSGLLGGGNGDLLGGLLGGGNGGGLLGGLLGGGGNSNDLLGGLLGGGNGGGLLGGLLGGGNNNDLLGSLLGGGHAQGGGLGGLLGRRLLQESALKELVGKSLGGDTGSNGLIENLLGPNSLVGNLLHNLLAPGGLVGMSDGRMVSTTNPAHAVAISTTIVCDAAPGAPPMKATVSNNCQMTGQEFKVQHKNGQITFVLVESDASMKQKIKEAGMFNVVTPDQCMVCKKPKN